MLKDIAISPGQIGELDKKLRALGIKDTSNIQELLDNKKKFERFVKLLLDEEATFETGFDKEPAGAHKVFLEKLFDYQIATPRDRGCPEQIVEIFQGKKPAVIERALSIWEEKYPSSTLEYLAGIGIYFMIPVIPRSFRSPYDLMAMVRNGRKDGYTNLNPMQIFDVVDAPQEPYYIYDVEDGSRTLGMSSENAEKAFKQQKRSPLTAAEDMALATHTDVLFKHCVWATGSRFGSAGGVPSVCLGSGGRPRLGWYDVGGSDGHWGSASCGSRA